MKENKNAENSIHQKPLTNPELSLFCEQLSVTLSAGISATEGIRLLLEGSESSEEKELLTCILDRLEGGGSLFEALKGTGVFPSYLLNMVHIGEETGTLDEVMSSLSDFYEREEIIARTVKNAVTFPAFMGGLMLVVVLVLLWKVMPVFNQVYNQLGTELPGPAAVLLHIGEGIGRYWVVILAAAVVIAAAALYFAITKEGRKTRMNLSCRTGIGRKTYDDIAALRFAGAMSLLLHSGMDAERSLALAEAVNDNPIFREKLDRCAEMLQEGISLGKAVFDAGIFKGNYGRMLALSARAGAEDQMMERIAGLYQEAVDESLNRRLARLEPAMVIMMSLLVGLILLSVMLPLMSIMSGI